MWKENEAEGVGSTPSIAEVSPTPPWWRGEPNPLPDRLVLVEIQEQKELFQSLCVIVSFQMGYKCALLDIRNVWKSQTFALVLVNKFQTITSY